MSRVWIRRLFMILVGLALTGAIVYAYLPQPVQVDLARVTHGPLRVTVDEDGQTRTRERYTISAPLAGRLLRIKLDPGDDAQTGQLLAVIEPRDPELLDTRARAESQARVEAAQAAVNQAQANLQRAAAEHGLAQNDAQKYQRLFEQGSATQKERDDAVLLEQVRSQELKAARFASQVAQYRLKLAQAALIHTNGTSDAPPSTGRLLIHAPCDGRILRVHQESEGFVNAGTPLLEFGDPTDLEAVVDVLSTDAVAIEPGDSVMIEHWGGDHALRGQVRVVEPSAFTKVSSLGVEEQRVNVIIDLVDPPQTRDGLGDGYRVEAAIVIWQEDNVLKAPTSALFRRDGQWAVLSVEEGRAIHTPVTLGRRNGLEAQVINGLSEGDLVVIHPSDNVHPGVSVEQR